MSEVKNRLIYFISKSNLSVSDFEKKAGLSNGFVSKTNNNIRKATLRSISSAFPELNIDWLIKGEGDMILPIPESNATLVGPYIEPELGNPGVYRLPSLPITAQATFTESATFDIGVNPLEDFKDVQLLPDEIPIRKSLTTIQVDGESMEHTLADGAWVLSRRLKDSQWGNVGGVVFVSYGEYFVVKRIKSNKLFSENYMILSSDNKEYGEMTVQLCDIHAMWKAMRIISSPIL